MVLLTAQLIPAARLPAYIHKINYYEKTTSILDIFFVKELLKAESLINHFSQGEVSHLPQDFTE